MSRKKLRHKERNKHLVGTTDGQKVIHPLIYLMGLFCRRRFFVSKFMIRQKIDTIDASFIRANFVVHISRRLRSVLRTCIFQSTHHIFVREKKMNLTLRPFVVGEICELAMMKKKKELASFTSVDRIIQCVDFVACDNLLRSTSTSCMNNILK